MRKKRDTVPAPPVPSRNPAAQLRTQLENALLQTQVAILRDDSGLWRGLVVEDGMAEFYTIEMWEAEARAWLKTARAAARARAWIPTVCPRCAHARETPSTCMNCRKLRFDERA